ncbi:EamA family transporter, partial [Romeria aff. gracilis LEGE 07310]
MPSTIGRLSPTAIGIIFVLLGATALAIQNVVARLIFSPSQLFGQVPVGGFLDAAMGSILVLLLLRMAGMAMVLAAIAPRLYPATFSDLRQLPHLRRLFWQAIASGVCLFLALALTYLALSQAAAGIAIAIVFIYPAITMLMAWKVFGQRPPLHQRWLLLVILFGVLLTSLDPQDMTLSNSALGIFAALGASLAFGGYNILSEVCLQPSQRYP